MQSRIVIIGILLAMLVSCGKSPQKLLETADNHIEAGEYDMAISTYNDLIASHAEDTLAPEAYYRLARLYLDRLRDYDRGYEILTDLTVKYPNSKPGTVAQTDIAYFPDWLLNTAESQRKKKEIQKSIKTLNYLIERFPEYEKSPMAQYLIGDIYMNNIRDFGKAIANYGKVVDLFYGSGQDAHAQFMIGYIYANVLNDNEKAKESYSVFLEKYPSNELVPSVRFELEYLGMDINEIPALKHIAGDEPALPQ